MDKHTPGPWAALPEECDKPYIRIRGTALGCRYKVANVLTPIYVGVHDREARETRANACLIAAAPELLCELRSALDEIEEALQAGYLPAQTDRALEHRAQSIRAVIAKAKGEE